MDLAAFQSSAVVATLISAPIAIVGVWISRTTTIRVNKEKIAADRDLAERRFEIDRELAERKFNFDKELAERKFALEKGQLIYKRRFEVAEALLADGYRFRDVMRAARANIPSDNEGETRKSPEGETAELRKLRNSYFIPLERLNKHSEFLAKLFAKQDTAVALFGPDTRAAFNLFVESLNDVRIASDILIQTAGFPGPRSDSDRELLADLWLGHASVLKREDKVAKRIDDGVKLLEKLCQPVLSQITA